MAPPKLFLFSALFFPLLLLMVPSHRLVNAACTTPAIRQATNTICGINAGSDHHRMKCARLPELAELSAIILSKISPNVCVPNETFCSCGKNIQVFSLKELKTVTNNFHERLDCTNIFSYYHGRLSDGRLVAVKHYKGDVLQEKYFKRELEVLSKTRHENVIDLIGYCRENDEWLLVFEFTPCNNLYKHLHPEYWAPRSLLFYSWKLRVKILLDVAKGIEYLHRYAKPQIIHGNIISYNIVFDENWVAKISDFSLAVFGPESEIDKLKHDWYSGAFRWEDKAEYNYLLSTPRNDVYRFGILMLEMVTGSAHAIYELPESVQLVEFAHMELLRGRIMSLLDDRLPVPKGRGINAVSMVAVLATMCARPIEFDDPRRPSLSFVVLKLEQALAMFGHASEDTENYCCNQACMCTCTCTCTCIVVPGVSTS